MRRKLERFLNTIIENILPEPAWHHLKDVEQVTIVEGLEYVDVCNSEC
jgi:hypothetical protein